MYAIQLRAALCEIFKIVKDIEPAYLKNVRQNVRQDLIPRVRHGEVALCTPYEDLETKI